MKVATLLADGFEECEALIVVDILRRAGVEVIMVSVTDKIEIRSSRNIGIIADELIDDVDFDSVDMIFLPGGRTGTENLQKNNEVKKLCKLFEQNKRIAAICAAPSILADLELLEGKHATCHPDYESKMKGALLTECGVAVDGNIVTGQGLGATFPFAFELVKILVGGDAVARIKKAICY